MTCYPPISRGARDPSRLSKGIEFHCGDILASTGATQKPRNSGKPKQSTAHGNVTAPPPARCRASAAMPGSTEARGRKKSRCREASSGPARRACAGGSSDSPPRSPFAFSRREQSSGSRENPPRTATRGRLRSSRRQPRVRRQDHDEPVRRAGGTPGCRDASSKADRSSPGHDVPVNLTPL